MSSSRSPGSSGAGEGGFREDVAGAPWPFGEAGVAVTRPAGEDDRLVEILEARGVRVLSTPALRIVPVPDPNPLRRAAAGLTGFHWVVVSSVNGARALGAAVREALGRWPAESPPPRVCAVGPATAVALEKEGIPVHLVPERFVGEGILDAMDAEGPLSGCAILLPRPAEGRDLLPRELARRGARVVEVEAYRNEPDSAGLALLAEEVRRGRVAVVALTAGSAARRVHRALGGAPPGVRFAAIGPATARVARELGLPVDAVAEPHTAEGLAEACLRLLAEDGRLPG